MCVLACACSFLWHEEPLLHSDKQRNKSTQKMIIMFPKKRCWKPTSSHHHLSLRTAVFKLLKTDCSNCKFFIRHKNICILIYKLYTYTTNKSLILENFNFTHTHTHAHILVFSPHLLWVIPSSTSIPLLINSAKSN